jgi:hypothetical protein
MKKIKIIKFVFAILFLFLLVAYAYAAELLYDPLEGSVDGVKGKATYFKDGNSSSYSPSGHFNPNEGTISFWVKPDFTSTANFGMFEAGNLGYANSLGIFNINYYNRRVSILEIRNNASSYLQAWNDLNNIRINESKWYYVTAVWKCNSGANDFFQLFINGFGGYRHTSNSCENFKNPSTLILGKTHWYGYTNAAYDEFKIFDYAKTSTEILNDYNSYFPIKCRTNSDCGTDGYVGNSYCSGKDVKRNYITYSCVNPGTTSSYCSNSTTAKLIQTCSYACIDALCVNPAQEINWLKKNQYLTGLVESQIGWSDHRSFTYDQALAAIAFTHSGSLVRARLVLDAMASLQNSDGSWYSAYYTDTKKPWEWSMSTGNAAWMIIAINYYEAKTGDKQYTPSANKALLWLNTRINNNQSDACYKGFNLGKNFWDIPNPEKVFSTEHNLDVYSALKNRAKLTTNAYIKSECERIANDTKNFLARQWNGNAFYRGCKDYEMWLDPQTWGYMVLGNGYSSGISFAENNMVNTLPWNGANVQGHQYNNYNKNSIWVEGTAQMADAYGLLGNQLKQQFYLNEISKVTQSDGGIPYSFNGVGGAIAWPDNLRYSSVSSTVWSYFARNKINPFWV